MRPSAAGGMEYGHEREHRGIERVERSVGGVVEGEALVTRQNHLRLGAASIPWREPSPKPVMSSGESASRTRSWCFPGAKGFVRLVGSVFI